MDSSEFTKARRDEGGANAWLSGKKLINGRSIRGRLGSCPECGMREDAWCSESCTALDVMDYR